MKTWHKCREFVEKRLLRESQIVAAYKMGEKCGCGWNTQSSGLWDTPHMSLLSYLFLYVLKHVTNFFFLKWLYYMVHWWSDDFRRKIKYRTLIVICSFFLCPPISFISFTWQAMEANWKRTWMKMTKDGSTGR